jgi:hypothetical protein
MSQISPSSQPLYGGSMPSGTASYASPTVPSPSPPHEGMSTTDKILISGGSLVAAVAVGTGIYYLAKKDKPSGKKTSDTSTATQRRDGTRSESASKSREQVQHENNHTVAPSSRVARSESASTVHETRRQNNDDTMSLNAIAFLNDVDSKPIQDLDRLFKSLNPQEKNKVRTANLNSIKYIRDHNELESIKMIYFICENGHLSPEINQAFNLRAEELGINLDDIDFNKDINEFASFSEAEQAEHISNDIGAKTHLLDPRYRDRIKFYYSRFMKPKTSTRVRELIDRW